MISSDEFQHLTDSIYEAAVVPELWPTVLGRLSGLIDGAGGVLFTTNLDRMRWEASPDIHDTMVEFLRDGWAEKNPRPTRMRESALLGFACDHDHFSPEELASDPVYEFYRRRGLGWAVGTMFDVPSGDTIIFSFERRHEIGPVDRSMIGFFDSLRPHLARAALLGARRGLEKARAMAHVLAEVGLPAAVLRGPGRLYAANPLFEVLVPEVCRDRLERLAFTDPAVDRLFADGLEMLAQARLLPDARSVCSIPIPAQNDKVPMLVHLLPVRRTAQDFFSLASALVVITPVDRTVVPNAELLTGLFDLTPAEARVARGIAAGLTLDVIGKDVGVARDTVRNQLKAVFAKTGLNRQADLVALLGGLTLPGAD
ncbi:helix-turn-helix transcriptional regulator [Bradyrhizobium sp. Arg68]|uniref:helix-turn-helix transcriptional regulator n=1 Tax=Bradyrhizobium ivorense TaxID=2511166 RepID=UPI001E41A21D|nr:helix-turn-helix transcriptional regulator [Bradyrhizobium ivorense]MCC8938110.1 helix-turn-helix transcriptional regulator [Bradyrhizobium ivorense]